MPDFAANMPELDRNFELLWRHYFLVSSFGVLPRYDGYANDFRHTLIYLITKASRHYRESRRIVLAAHGVIAGASEDQDILILVEFPFSFEDFINAVRRATDMVLRLVEDGKLPDALTAEIMDRSGPHQKIKILRDMVEHIVPRVIHNRNPDQPIRMRPSDDGSHVRLGTHTLRFADAVQVLHWLFDAAIMVVPTFSAGQQQSDVAPGPFMLTATATVSITERAVAQPSDEDG
jgi:hypothetical protein